MNCLKNEHFRNETSKNASVMYEEKYQVGSTTFLKNEKTADALAILN